MSTAPPSPSSIGHLLEEEEFKALHHLRGDTPPELHGEMVDLGGGARAYLSLPEGASAPLPAVILIHEFWGLNDHIRHWADRVAAAGYAALAVDMYGGQVPTTRDDAVAFMKAVDDEQGLALLEQAHAFLERDPRVRATRTATLGWCFGGGWSLRAAMAIDGLDAAVIYYGRLVTDPEQLKAIEAPLLGVFGNRDTGIPPSEVDAFDQALDQAGVPHVIHRYDADHAFANPSGERYDTDAAEDAWRKVRAFLDENLQR